MVNWVEIWKWDILHLCVGCLLVILSGGFDGISEILKHNYDKFKTKFLGCNDNFWKPGLSWKNKYKNNEPSQGSKFFGSTTFLVWLTDGYHLMRTIRNGLIIPIIILPIKSFGYWWLYIIIVILLYLVYTSGFNLVYHKFFNKKVKL